MATLASIKSNVRPKAAAGTLLQGKSLIPLRTDSISNPEPWCFVTPSEVQGYEVVSLHKVKEGYNMDLNLISATEPQYGEDIPKLRVSVTFETKDRVHVKITDAVNQRWEIPESIFPLPAFSAIEEEETNYIFSIRPSLSLST